ncbi:ATP-binding cassette domain-containing protein [Youngiibacter multivorans]|uniref:NitT/TauT family transport system ATP-binding protein n=1 Tax=Youngiibacter multivorans TaxID=937251 RepID=A0ABS4G072_9CLOT|nr:ATP-binding cassette domain-containing protein [Youngiibacter multivorans]MBP1917950.1 NitT/TauT family transport system ATP-binding protein [Youngiibacter multivorans]
MDISVSGIKKSFGEKIVLDGFSGTFRETHLTCIMGPSGCGKTTLLNILMGIELQDEGAISGMPKKPGAVFQEDRLCESFNAISNVRMVCAKGMKDSFIASHLESIGISDLSQPVREFSGGMKRRVAIVRAILSDSDILFLDEPFKGLDDDTKNLVMDYVVENTRNRTVVLVTHSLDEVKALDCDMILMGEKE